MHEALSPLAAWDNFYVIVGSSAGALIGLMFVVITLSADIHANIADISAFGSPTVVHFSTALLISAVACAPWPAAWYPGSLLGVIGLGGLAYVAIVIRRGRRAEYKPVMEDWLTHIIGPAIAYALLAAGGARLLAAPVAASFAIALAALLLLFLSIHNAWDTVIYIAIERLPREK